MSSGRKDDIRNTKSAAKGVIPTTSEGKTWLGHVEKKQYGLNDLLILEAVYSVKEIAMKFERAFPGVTDSVRRVAEHIENLQTGNSRDRLQAVPSLTSNHLLSNCTNTTLSTATSSSVGSTGRAISRPARYFVVGDGELNDSWGTDGDVRRSQPQEQRRAGQGASHVTRPDCKGS